MSQPPDLPVRPEDLKAWIESLKPDELKALTQSVAGGALGRLLGDPLEAVRKPIPLADPPAEPQLLIIRVWLNHSKRPVWRRLTVPGDLRLADVHTVLQAAMGWSDYHLHRFYLDDPWGGSRFVTDDDIEEGEEGIREADVRLDQILREPGQKLGYAYDFGDGWLHTVRLEKAAPMPRTSPDGAEAPTHRIVCLAGARACPPEDVGGIGGYLEMADWVRHDFDQSHAPGHWDVDNLAELREWLPLGWHPDEFSVNEVNEALRMAAPEVSGALSRLPWELRRLAARRDIEGAPTVGKWLTAVCAAGRPEFTEDEAAALTRPWRTVLDVVGDGQALTTAGYLKPTAVETIFRALDLDEEWIGKGNREDLTPPVAHLREQARRFGLVRRVKGRLVPTARGRTLRVDPAALLQHVIGDFPVPRDEFGRLATLLTLLGVAAGGTVRRWDDNGVLDAVRRVLDSAGWRRSSGPLERWDVLSATGDTVDILRSTTRGVPEAEATSLQARFALAALQATGD